MSTIDFYVMLQTFDEAEKNHWMCMQNEWEQQKLKILNSLLGSEQDSLEFSADVFVRNEVLSKFTVVYDSLLW